METFHGIKSSVTLRDDRIVIEKNYLGQESVTTIFLRDIIGVQCVQLSKADPPWLEFVTAGNFSNVLMGSTMDARACVVYFAVDQESREKARQFRRAVEDAAIAAKTAGGG